MTGEHNADHPTAQETALGALLALDALYDGKPNGFRRQVETEDFGDVFEHALPEFRAAYTKAADVIDAAMPTAQTPPAPEEGRWTPWNVFQHEETGEWHVQTSEPTDNPKFSEWDFLGPMSEQLARRIVADHDASLAPSDFWRNPTLPANQPSARGLVPRTMTLAQIRKNARDYLRRATATEPSDAVVEDETQLSRRQFEAAGGVVIDAQPSARVPDFTGHHAECRWQHGDGGYWTCHPDCQAFAQPSVMEQVERRGLAGDGIYRPPAAASSQEPVWDSINGMYVYPAPTPGPDAQGAPAATGEAQWAGAAVRDCGEHRTTGMRAWCYDCSEWCYPSSPCVRCEGPELRASLAVANERAEAAEAEYRALVRRLQDLTPGGSEFVDSPDNCINYAVRRMEEQGRINVKLAGECNAADERVRTLEAGLGAIAFGAGSRHDKEIAFKVLGQEARERLLDLTPTPAAADAEGEG